MTPLKINNTRTSQTDILRELVKVIDGGKDCVTLDELDTSIEELRKRIINSVSRLIARDLVQSKRLGCYVPTQSGCELIASGGTIKSGKPISGRRKSPKAKSTSQRARFWRAILVLRRATVSEIVQRAAKEEEIHAVQSCRSYVGYLCRAGYLVKLPRRQAGTSPTSNGEIVYFLKQSFGRLPPRVRTSDDGVAGMFDPNNNSWRPFQQISTSPKACKPIRILDQGNAT